jgi:hypothetical protein
MIVIDDRRESQYVHSGSKIVVLPQLANNIGRTYIPKMVTFCHFHLVPVAARFEPSNLRRQLIILPTALLLLAKVVGKTYG